MKSTCGVQAVSLETNPLRDCRDSTYHAPATKIQKADPLRGTAFCILRGQNLLRGTVFQLKGFPETLTYGRA